MAIVMKAMELAYKNELDSLTLIAGDGDFRDCVEFITKTVGKKVSMFGYSASFNESLSLVASPGCTYKLDEIWQHISEPLPEGRLAESSDEEGEQNGKRSKRKNGKNGEKKLSPKMKITNAGFEPTKQYNGWDARPPMGHKHMQKQPTGF